MCMRVYGTTGTVDSHYGGPVKITGDNPWDGVDKENIFREGAQRNVKQFVANIKEGKVTHNGDVSAESTLTCVLGRTAAYEEREVTWDEMMRK